jgi:hypothetical protein
VPPTSLAFGNLLSESFTFFFNRLGLFFHLVTVPWILSLLLRIGGAAMGETSLVAVLAEKAIDVLPTVMFLVAWMRLVLLGPARVGRLPGLGWTSRESAFFVHLLKVAGITFLLISAFVLTVGTIDTEALRGGAAAVDPDLARREAMAAPLGTGFIVSALLALRVSFGLAASAVDVPFSPRLSWAYSRGHAWTIIGALFLIFMISAIATTVAAFLPLALVRGVLGADTAAAVVTWTVMILVSYAGAAVAATAQAIIFRRLTGWRDGAPLAPPNT